MLVRKKGLGGNCYFTCGGGFRVQVSGALSRLRIR